MDGVWTRDGSHVVVSTSLTRRYNLWTVPAAGGFPLQLTRSDDRRFLSAPLLVLQSDNDSRAPKGQAVEVTDLLKTDGRTIDAHYFPNESHGFVRRENQIEPWSARSPDSTNTRSLKRSPPPTSQPDRKSGE